MALFELAIPTVLRHEGGLVNDPDDAGGATNYGVSLRWLKSKGLLGDLDHDGDVDQNDIKIMTREDATAFYHKFWWDAYHYDRFNAQSVATKVFDMSVNLGAPRAHRIVQAALGLAQDGILGSKSYGEANAVPSLTLLTNLQSRQAAFYRGLVIADPVRQKYLAGWLNRAYDRS